MGTCEGESVYQLVHSLVNHVFGKKDVDPSRNKRFNRVRRKAFETILLSSTPQTDSSSGKLMALAEIFNAVSFITQDSMSRENNDDNYQLVPTVKQPTTFEKLSLLIDKFDFSTFFFSETNENGPAHILRLLSALASKNAAPTVPPSQHFYCPQHLLNHSEKLFSSDPGWTFPGSSFFSKSSKPSTYSHNLTQSLFCALVRKTKNPLSSLPNSESDQSIFNLNLEFPNLPNDPEQFAEGTSLLPSYLKGQEASSEERRRQEDSSEVDEGFGSTPCSPHHFDPINLHHLPPSLFHDEFTLDQIGKRPPVKHLLTEAGCEAFDKFLNVRHLPLMILKDDEKDFLGLEPQFVEEAVLVENLQLLLLGCSSPLFTWDEEEQQFLPTSNLCISGLESIVLKSCMVPYLRHGKFVKNLLLLCDQSLNMTSFKAKGLVYQAFLQGIRQQLQYFKAFIVDLKAEEYTLLQFSLLMRKHMEQIEVLVDVCQVDDNCSTHLSDDKNSDLFPLGMDLLSYIYDKTLDCYMMSEIDTYPFMLSLLINSLAPYLHFVSNWVYYGHCRDQYGEFHIKTDDRCLALRDRRYWTKGYVLTVSDGGSSVPDFLRPLIKDIYSCGKSINLLRLCSPQHHVSNLESDAELNEILPELVLTLDDKELRRVYSRCQYYSVVMETLSNTRLLRRNAAKEKRHERGRGELKGRMEILDEQIKATRNRIQEKKKKELRELKTQMETATTRKRKEMEEEREKDKGIMEEYEKTEIAMRQKEDDVLENKVKEEMVKYYGELMEQAEARERIAIWKLQRGLLDEERRAFLLETKDAWMEEGKRKVEGEVKQLPSWATARILLEQEQKDKQFQDHHQTEVENPSHPDLVENPSHSEPDNILNDYLVDSGLESEATVSSVFNLPSWAQGDAVLGVQQISSLENTDKDETLDEIVTPANDTPTHIPALPEEDSNRTSIIATLDNSSFDVTTFRKTVPGRHVSKLSEQSTFILSNQANIVETSLMLEPDSSPVDPPVPPLVGPHPHVSDESFSEENIPLKQNISNSHAPESQELPSPQQHITNETMETPPKMTSRGSPLRHVSSQSQETLLTTTSRGSPLKHVSKESQDRETLLKTTSRGSPLKHVSNQSEERDLPSWSRGSSLGSYSFQPSSISSLNKDNDERPSETKKFPTQLKMHPSYSTIQDKMYVAHSSDFDKGVLFEKRSSLTPNEISLSLLEKNLSRLRDRFPSFSTVLGADLLSSNEAVILTRAMDDHKRHVSVEIFNAAPRSVTSGRAGKPWTQESLMLGSFLPSILQRCIGEPLKTQIRIVDSAIVDCFTEDLNVKHHFSSLRQFLLMEDGEFSQRLSDQLFERISNSRVANGQDVLNPVVLNDILRNALRFSSRVSSDDQDVLSEILSFAISNNNVETINLKSPKSLSCLEFRYSVSWPLNVIITDSTLAKYAKLFTFMLQLRQAVWHLKDVFHSLKKCPSKRASAQIHRLQLFRHEMLHFVTVMQGFIANQVIHNCWEELILRMGKNVTNLDSLYTEHADYLNTAILRCLLNPKASRVMEIIQGIFGLIAKFRNQLLAYPVSVLESEAGHPNFQGLTETYNSYVKHSQFLFRAVSKLAEAGYQPHLQDFLLRLNYNEFYRKDGFS